MKKYNSVSEFADDYDGFILDIWGVIHDGHETYPGVVYCMKKLVEMKKEIVFLSNAPRRADKVAEVLAKFGITRDMYKDVLSSGEVAYRLLAAENRKGSYIYIGPEKDRDLLNGLNIKETANASEADFAVVTGFDNDDSVLEEKLPQIKAALAANLTLYCVNPDMIVVRQNGTSMLCAGVIGQYYDKQGGEVVFIGKPFPQVYDFAFKKFSKHIDKNRIAAIGDGLETDILGANNVGIDSILCLGGILKAEKEPLEKVMEKSGATPTATLPTFKFQ